MFAHVRSWPAVILGILLFLGFYFFYRPWGELFGDNETLRAIRTFLHPGLRQDTLQWLAGRSILLAAGVIALVVLSTGMAGPGILGTRPRHWMARARSEWPRLLWAFLFATGVVGTFFVIADPWSSVTHPSRRHDIITQTTGVLLNIATVIGVAASARLLLAGQRARIDFWLGYLMAGGAIFELVWRFFMLLGITDLGAPLALPASYEWGIFLGSALLLWGKAWSGLYLARCVSVQPRSAPLSVIGLIYLVIAGIGLSVAWGQLQYLTFFWPRPAIAYLVLLPVLIFAAITLAALLQALSLLPDSRVALAVSADPPGCRLSFPHSRRFWIDLAIGVALSVAFMGLGFLSFAWVPVMALAFIAPLVMLALYTGPILVLVFAVLHRRWGIAVGAILVPLALYAIRVGNELMRQ